MDYIVNCSSSYFILRLWIFLVLLSSILLVLFRIYFFPIYITKCCDYFIFLILCLFMTLWILVWVFVFVLHQDANIWYFWYIFAVLNNISWYFKKREKHLVKKISRRSIYKLYKIHAHKIQRLICKYKRC